MSAMTDIDPFVRPQVGALRAGRPEETASAAGFGFADFLDVINPLQHLPVIGTLYRAATGDEIAGTARVLGGALYGGPVGLVLGAMNAAMAEGDGGDLGTRVLQAMTREDPPADTLASAGDVADAGPPDPPAPSEPAEPPEEAPLTGIAALRAFAADRRLAVSAQDAPKLAAVPPETSFRPLRTSDFRGARPPGYDSRPARHLASAGGPAAPGSPSIAEGPVRGAPDGKVFESRMMEALMKYNALKADDVTAAE